MALAYSFPVTPTPAGVIPAGQFDSHPELSVDKFVAAIHDQCVSPGSWTDPMIQQWVTWGVQAVSAAPDSPDSRYAFYVSQVGAFASLPLPNGQKTLLEVAPAYFKKVGGVVTHNQLLYIGIGSAIAIAIVIALLIFMRNGKKKEVRGPSY